VGLQQTRMNLATRLAEYFTAAVRNRGRNYFWQGRARIRNGSSAQVVARVRGSQTYEVSLSWHDGVLSGWCDCAYYESNCECKHLWATILAADAGGYLSAAASPDLTVDFGGYEFGAEGELDDVEEQQGSPFRLGSSVAAPKPVPQPPAWKKQISDIADPRLRAGPPADPWPSKREIFYAVDVTASLAAGCLILSVGSRDRKADGSWTRVKPLSLKHQGVGQLPLADDREILAALGGGLQYWGYVPMPSYSQVPANYAVTHPLAASLIPMVCRTGRCFLRSNAEPDALTPLTWDEGQPWKFRLEMGRLPQGGWAVSGVLHRGEECMDLATPALVTQGGLVIVHGRVAPLAEDARFEWMAHLRKAGPIKAPEKDKDQLLATLLCSRRLPPLEVPEELGYQEVRLPPRPCLRVRSGDRFLHNGGRLRAELSFDYEGRLVPEHEPVRGFYEAENRRFLPRDSAAEQDATRLLGELGLKYRAWTYGDPQPAWELAPTKLPGIVRALVAAGWHIEAEGKIFRRPGDFRIEVATGVDWFEVHGEMKYGETEVKLPQLLEALRRGNNMVQLDDGTYGVLPEEWLRRIGLLVGLGTPEGSHLRFRRSQAGFLDALLATQPEARCDETFSRLREQLRMFEGVRPSPQPAGFVGQLRDYQCEGLGWMEFLSRFSFGGCLADDMGVGKTAQVLALLETRRALRAAGEPLPPSLVVVPRSLVFNWKEEAARFTPQLRLLDHTGAGRDVNDFAAHDVIVTTYGTLRREVLTLKEIEFDYVVLDEAQAIKNALTESAKAARLLSGRHRLALSGTPVENHLGELWSLFEFLNPGMLGAASVFKMAGVAARGPDEETRRLLAQALRPFILRRTKEQVARELPPKTEQTVHCEMEPSQRQLYNELRQHYRDVLLKRIEIEGLAKSKIQVLEALLRLRQAACHPGLLDPERRSERSAKVDTLLEQLREVTDEGHKALVFSQFTTLLSIVRERLDSSHLAYEYLDGATRDRQTPVERFQNDPNCRLFLISLKAGGLGLNLTAAEYVFLLDPWWNPAVESQAMDRAHRIGQTRQVFAYRLIARDTVEEKILELQKTKRNLAAAIISVDNSLIRNLRQEDLELLLS
jgi:superfamily II DNA or RNA helicase